jgi:hypothetical protein
MTDFTATCQRRIMRRVIPAPRGVWTRNRSVRAVRAAKTAKTTCSRREPAESILGLQELITEQIKTQIKKITGSDDDY